MLFGPFRGNGYRTPMAARLVGLRARGKGRQQRRRQGKA
jgi:hypothetical protein